MDERQVKKIIVSDQFDLDIFEVFEYGEKTFGNAAARAFVAEIYSLIWTLDANYLLFPENRYLKTPNKSYRNIIIGSYLIIYKIEKEIIKVLRILRSEVGIKQIKSARKAE
ncbi:MAG: type II toxin-antitoxin system RelE/ParE family toxin [Bacteroidota bacterium]